MTEVDTHIYNFSSPWNICLQFNHQHMQIMITYLVTVYPCLIAVHYLILTTIVPRLYHFSSQGRPHAEGFFSFFYMDVTKINCWTQYSCGKDTLFAPYRHAYKRLRIQLAMKPKFHIYYKISPTNGGWGKRWSPSLFTDNHYGL